MLGSRIINIPFVRHNDKKCRRCGTTVISSRINQAPVLEPLFKKKLLVLGSRTINISFVRQNNKTLAGGESTVIKCPVLDALVLNSPGAEITITVFLICYCRGRFVGYKLYNIMCL